MESHQPQKRPSLHLLTDEGGAASGSVAGAGSVGGAIAEMSPTSGFLPDMPQWKKDLIQRRKTNVARTQAASIASPTEGGGSCGALAEVPVPGASNADAAPGSTSQALAKRNANATLAEEKSEKSLIGGHHTQGKDFVVAAVASNEVAPALAATTTTTIATTAPIPKQRSSLLNTQRSQEQQQQPEILNSELRERGEPAAGMVGLSVRSHIRGEVESGTAAAETTGALTETAAAAAAPATTSSSSSSANQLLTKCKPGQSVAEGSLFPEASQLDNKSSSSSCKTKSISDKLQSNKFIQQQQHQYHQQQQQLSPSKVTVKPTMVAMQEMKKTTKQNGQHRHIPGKISAGSGGGGDSEVSPSNLQDSLVDTGEDLSYGPGIVSKLRCRYLSLALRESRQQNSKQRLQRSTSLNTLLDRDDDEGDGEAELPEDGPTVVAISQVRAKSTPPPILGAKPTPKPIQRPVSLGANGTVPPAAVNPPSAANSEDTKPGGVTNGGGGATNGGVNRSRHFKRGNEVMKRARSVEALLCEKSPWNSQRSSNMTPGSNAPAAKTLTATSPAASPTCVTIEDKIHNARERLHSGTDTAPPKRLASIIDDTERPPPDLVKQTLKMFEASANRRPRTAHRSNGVGGVASKVASYKSIIKEQKVAPPSVGFASSTPLRPVNHPDIIPRQSDTSMSTLSMMMRRIDLPETEQPAEELVATNVTQPNEAPSETEPRDEGDGDEGGDRGDVAGEGDDDNNEKHDNDNDDVGDGVGDGNDGGDGDGDGDGENNDKMGAAGDKPRPKSPATEAGGAQQRSFAPSTENVHVAAGSGGGVTPVRKLNTESSSSTSTTKQIGVIRPLFNSQGITPPLTSREIEKNRINEMKKSTEAGGSIGSGAGSGSGTGSLASPTTSLDTVINTKEPPTGTSSHNISETDATASPLWTLRKTGQRGQNQGAGIGGGVGMTASSSHTATENTSMVFNFSKSTNKVPDYIESDVVIYRRKRELPKPNEPGFVLLGDLSVETSTDTDYDDLSMCPPSPCDVEFENANIVIDGKSSIRQKPKESTFRVQFNDTLTSTFEYPSEASMTIDDPPYADPFGHVSKHHQMLLAEQMHLLQQQQLDLEQQQQQQHHHVTVDEIIELPTSTAGQGHGHGHGHGNNKQAASAAAGATGGGTMLGNLPLDYPSLGRGIILPQSPQQQQQQQQQQPPPESAKHNVATSPPKETPMKPTGLEIAARNNKDVTVAKRPQLPAKPQPQPQRRSRPSVLLKPQYACFLQNDAPSRSLPPGRGPRKAASFSYSMGGHHQAPQKMEPDQLPSKQQSNYEKRERDQLQIPDHRERRRRPSLPSSLALPNASTALLQARIPGTTLYYV
ncbi:hypothetical protein KR074_011975 [Drosophila pseudoananassae]|nr:hypothetical protein KR074_011975 [Drosophila pseudoananassae]